MSVNKRLNQVFQEVFEDDELQIAPELTAADIEDWDSLMHVNLIMGIEQEFGIRFLSSEVTGLKNIGELMNLIEKKLS